MVVFIFMNIQIFQKETIKKYGERIYFKLAPTDPRAFMLGDYMALNFEHNLRNYSKENTIMFLITLNDQKVVIDAERYVGTDIQPNQRLLLIQDQLRPNRFYFQEGYAKSYESAKYGQFRYLSPQQFLLDGLTDDNLTTINP
ncbi:GDYXXLXY domain-containing protein [Wohlfahrtiimonas larvae]|uniref:GDYXXLXY domain-containing protein n=2 Tax=Wohlfahrtiimonas larvae TaxID=1157986 RepID=A0ABP9MF40_9GAMM